MEIQLLNYEPRRAEDGSPDSYVFQGKTFFPYVVNYTVNGQPYQGEANVTSTPPWWEIGKTYDASITNNARFVGGTKVTFTRPPENHTGGSPFRQNHTYPPAPQNQQAQQPPPPQKHDITVPSKEDFRQSLIVAQTSMKVAVEYVTSITEPERLALQESLQTEEDIVSKYALKIAKETYGIANNLVAPPY